MGSSLVSIEHTSEKRGVLEAKTNDEGDPSEGQRRTKFTDANVRQIINLVERGRSAAEIAEVIGVTEGTLRTT
jgi:DNA-binding NarL/FixJ family response regulator